MRRKSSWVLTVLAWLLIVFGLFLIVGALAPDLPDASLSVSEEVAMVIVGIVVAAGALAGLFLQVRNRLLAGRSRCRARLSEVEALVTRRRDLTAALMGLADECAVRQGGDFGQVAAHMGPAATGRFPSTVAEAQATLVPAFQLAQEAYPELRADERFCRMFDQLCRTDDEIAAARTEYHNAVIDQSSRILSFPSSLAARLFKFSEAEFSELGVSQGRPQRAGALTS